MPFLCYHPFVIKRRRSTDVDIYVRHSKNCAHQRDKEFKGCQCPQWLYITNGRKRRSVKSGSWAVAEQAKLEEERRQIAKRYSLPPPEWPEEIATMKAEIRRLSGLIEKVLASPKRASQG
jgi:hypothetical protein